MEKTIGVSPLHSIKLPKPDFKNKKPLYFALKNRRTTRSIAGRKLSLQTISNLLWAASGVNRKIGPFGGKGRTSASASNAQEIDIYVMMEIGAYAYDPMEHQLLRKSEEDLRGMAISHGQRKTGSAAPVRLVYVADLEKYRSAGFQEPGLYDPEIQKSYYYVDTGIIAENVYLFASSEGLASWFHNCDHSALFKKLNLRPSQKALFGQTIGYPQKS
jgi:hypothetical protein